MVCKTIFRFIFRFSLIRILLLFLLAGKLSAQEEFSFNAPGSVCFMKYICFTPDHGSISSSRPLIFILGNEGQAAKQIFDNDSLKFKPQFYSYLFVYVPNKGGNPEKKLECLASLSHLLTTDNSYGSQNLFLQVNDKKIVQSDISNSDLKYVFKSVRLLSDNPDTTLADTSRSITEVFKASAEVFEKTEDEPGTFYTEEEAQENSEPTVFIKAQKKYFGPPTAFNNTLSGIVRDKSTGEALPFASIQVKGTINGTSSNADGFFTLLKVPADTSTLVVRYMGFENTEVFLTPQNPQKNFVIEMNPSSTLMKAVTIKDKREDAMVANKIDVSLVKMTPKKLEQLPGMGERDIMRSFQLLPGISASNESSSGLYVRGGTPDQNLVLYDGFTVYQVEHLYGFFSAFNSSAIKDVQLYKGGFESRFGGRLSSVTEITGKDGNQKKFNMGADLSLLSFNAFVEIPVGKKFSSVITFRKSYKGFIYNKIFNKFNTSNTTTQAQQGGPRGGFSQQAKVTSYFYDLNGKFTYRPGEKDILSLSIFNGIDKLDNSFSSSMPSFGSSGSNLDMSSTDLTRYGNIGGSLKWSRKWNSKLYGNTVLSYSNYFSERDRSQNMALTNSSGETTNNKNGVFENNDLRDYSLKTDYQWDIFTFSQLQFGAFGTLYKISYNYAQSDTASILERNNNSLLTGAYIQSKTKLFKDRVQIIPGLRASYFKTTDKIYYEPRASVYYNITEKLSVKAATGKYFQFANRVTREDIMSGSKDFWILSDGNAIPVSSAVHFIAGISYETTNYLFSAEGYYKEITNLTEYSLRFNPGPKGVSYQENFVNGLGYSKGMEFLLQKKTGILNGWVSYTLGETRNRFELYSDSYYPANHDATHEFKIVALYSYKRWDFSITWIYATGRPYTAPSGAYSISLLDGTTQDFFTVTAKNGLRLPDYHRCDLAANYKLLAGMKEDKRRREIGYLGFSIFNLYNRTNIWYKQFSIEDGQIIETNVTYLGFTPNITLSLKIR